MKNKQKYNNTIFELVTLLTRSTHKDNVHIIKNKEIVEQLQLCLASNDAAAA